MSGKSHIAIWLREIISCTSMYAVATAVRMCDSSKFYELKVFDGLSELHSDR